MAIFEDQNGYTPPKWRAWLHISMGVVYLLFATLVFSMKKFGNIDLSELSVWGLSALLSLYGLFRLWRGISDLKMHNKQ